MIQRLERGQPGRHGEGIPGQRPGLVDRTGRRHLLHDVSPSTVRPDRKAAPQHLAQASEIWGYAVEFLRATTGDPEAGDDFIEDQQAPTVASHVAQSGEEAVRRKDNAHVPGDRLDDDSGNLFRPALHRRFDVAQRVEPGHHCVLRGGRGDARRPRDTQRRHP